MRKIAVEYELSDEAENRLEKITEAYRKQGSDLSADKIFEFIMQKGSDFEVDKRFGVIESGLDIV